MRSHEIGPGSRPLVKVLFNLEPTACHGSAFETLWAERVGLDEYCLENVPFYAFGVSFQDTVLAPKENGLPVFSKVIRRGGHSTYRLVLNDSHRDDFDRYLDPLQGRGCSYEEGHKPLLAVDVPPEANIFEVYAGLEAGEKAGVWSFEEGHCGHPGANAVPAGGA